MKILNSKFKKDYKCMMGREFNFSLKTFFNMLIYHHLKYMYIYRRYEKKPNLIRRVILYHFTKKYGLEISVDAKIGESFYIGHPYNISIGLGAVIGDNVHIHKNCVVGVENRGKRKGIATIGNNVWIGINSVIVGKIKVGNDVLIAPNCYINFDVPDHSIVIGNPGKIIRKENAVRGYI